MTLSDKSSIEESKEAVAASNTSAEHVSVDPPSESTSASSNFTSTGEGVSGSCNDLEGAAAAEVKAAEIEIKPRDVRLAAMDLLSRREHLQRELAIKLGKRFGNTEDVAAMIWTAILSLETANLQSDARFCESYVSQRAGRGYGAERIRMELGQKGADSELASMALEACDCDWLQLAREVRSKKFGDAAAEDWAAKSKQLRFLQYRGFSGEVAAKACNAVLIRASIADKAE
jgi:regulatory protein